VVVGAAAGRQHDGSDDQGQQRDPDHDHEERVIHPAIVADPSRIGAVLTRCRVLLPKQLTDESIE
jgi:hypothetical protein